MFDSESDSVIGMKPIIELASRVKQCDKQRIMSDAYDSERIVQLVIQALPGATVELEDLTGTSDHWSMKVVSEAFDGKSRIARHRLIYGILAEPLKGPIHALALTTQTPEEASR